jgi:hypothetical protein
MPFFLFPSLIFFKGSFLRIYVILIEISKLDFHYKINDNLDFGVEFVDVDVRISI